MVTVERRGSIGAPVEVIWATLADFAHISAWAPNVDHSCLMTEQSAGPGTVRRIQTDRTTLLETVETWEPRVALGYRINGLPPLIRSVTNTWRLAESGSSTHVVLTTEIDTGPRPPQQVIAKAVGKRLGSASDQMLGGLRTWMEADERRG
ncbi:MAG: SRPBCC family protein [Acidimicrobiia bacterium]|nr:SRPBCC family protein [Acidimicrobiia bacterium]